MSLDLSVRMNAVLECVGREYPWRLQSDLEAEDKQAFGQRSKGNSRLTLPHSLIMETRFLSSRPSMADIGTSPVIIQGHMKTNGRVIVMGEQGNDVEEEPTTVGPFSQKVATSYSFPQGMFCPPSSSLECTDGIRSYVTIGNEIP